MSDGLVSGQREGHIHNKATCSLEHLDEGHVGVSDSCNVFGC